MIKNNYKLFLLGLILILSIFIGLNFVIGDTAGNSCYLYNDLGQSSCEANSEGYNCTWKNTSDDLWCDMDVGCCLPNECWQYDNTGDVACEANAKGLSCIWDSFPQTWTLMNGSTWTINGTCMSNFSSGTMDWGGMSDACWQFDAKQSQCSSSANAQTCTWKANEANQNPWCNVKSLSDAKAMNIDATDSDIGCCDMKGCWDYDGNETRCVNNTGFKGLCNWMSKSNDPNCPNEVGCCYTKWCNEVNDSGNCTKLKTDLYMPCEWGDNGCQELTGGMGGFTFFNDTDSCMMQGGWWNTTDCEMPGGFGGTGTGNFMFAEGATCWFADNQPNICKNLTGCIYCNETGTLNGTYGCSGTNNESSACYGVQVGFCQGHQKMPSALDIYQDDLNCTHIQIKSACEYGPLPNCIWKNASSISGSWCAPGTSSTKKAAPPVPFCEHSDALNNYTICMNLAEDYMMPCKWGNASSNKTVSDNCTFNSDAVFGTTTAGGEEKEYEIITSEYSCIAAGGTWKNEYYLDGGTLKQDSWCEKGGLFNAGTGQAAANKGNCNADCWACEFNGTGENYGGNVTYAEANCTGSALGYCVWANDSNAPNTMGWCDFPHEMDYGAGDCQTSCKDCDLMKTPYTACTGSYAGCKWQNDTNSTGDKIDTGFCIGAAKKTCNDDCFSCYDFKACNTSSVNCMWDSTNMYCQPSAFDGEVCFDGLDNDGDYMVDCADPDCSFDMACGGASFGDCMQFDHNRVEYSVDAAIANCTNTSAFGGVINCSWMNFTWEDVGHCGMPGEDCWQYDWNMTLCGLTEGCTNTTTSVAGGGFTFNAFCDINGSMNSELNCGQYIDETNCNEAAHPTDSRHTKNCTWQTSEWGDSYCAYWLWNECYNYGSNSTACSDNGNCTWNSFDSRCEIVCFNFSLDTPALCDGVVGGICELSNFSNTIADSGMCMPETFEVIGGTTGGKTGCAQYDGNESGCYARNFTCTWFNDSTVDNNVVGIGGADGWCNSKGEFDLSGDMKGQPIFLGMEYNSTGGEDELTIRDYVDIKGMGLRVSDTAYGFAMGIVNISDALLCYDYPLASDFAGSGQTGIGNNATKFHWYLDTNGCWCNAGNCSTLCPTGESQCTATDENGLAFYGFEFYISHVVQKNTQTNKNETKKQLYRCIQNMSSTSIWVWAPTNIFISDDKKFSCFASGVGAAYVSVEKAALEVFSEFNITAPMTVLGMSSDLDDLNMDDSAGPFYYTPGTIDFGFIDCSDPTVKDPKCKAIQKFGHQAYEDCKNGKDDDFDGLSDCADPKCTYTPACATTAFDFTLGTDDNKAPIITYSAVEKMDDAVFITFDTDEPANGTVEFYNLSSTCATLNKTLFDVGDDSFTFDDYKPFHKVTLNENSLVLNLTNGTTYFYKVKVCDTFGNCGTSKCLNFTTRKAKKNFIFRMDVPDGYTVDIPALSYSGNFTTNISSTVYDIGIKTNNSQTTDMNITVNYSDLSIKFVGADVYKPKSLELENAFIVDDTNDVLGMNSSSKAWHALIGDLGMGGSGDYIELDFSVTYNVNNTLTWYEDDLTDADSVGSYSNCSAGSPGHTMCKIPTSLGFSVYKIVVPVATTGDGSTTSGDSAVDESFWTFTKVLTDEEFEQGVTKSLKVTERVTFNVDSVSHHVGVLELTETTAKVEVKSEAQEATLSIGEEMKFDVTADGYYDVSVELNSIEDSEASFTLKSIYEEVPEEEGEEGEEGEGGKGVGEKLGLWWVWLIVAIVVIVVAVVVLRKKKK